MAKDAQELPMLYAYDGQGRLRHVDEVPNGLACRCVCPACMQALVARNAGTKLIHHFAHKAGSCAWAIESVLSSLAVQALREGGTIALPALSYTDALTQRKKELSPARLMRVEEATLCDAAQRGAADVLVRVSANGASRTFALVLSLTHGLSDVQATRLSEVSSGVVLIDLRRDLRRKKRLLTRHFDRAEIVRGYQDLSFIQALLRDTKAEIASWARNARAEELERKSVEEYERREREREARRLEQEARRREREERRRREEEEKRRSLADAQVAPHGKDESWKTISTEEMAELDRMEEHLRQAEAARRYEREERVREAQERARKKSQEPERYQAEAKGKKPERKRPHSPYDVTLWRQVAELKKGWRTQRGQLQARIYYVDHYLSITIICALDGAALKEVTENLEELRKGASAFEVRLTTVDGQLVGDGDLDECGHMWLSVVWPDGPTIVQHLASLVASEVRVHIVCANKDFALLQADVEALRLLVEVSG